jgi:biopolymer transport protein ExbD
MPKGFQRQRANQGESSGEINISPLIDVVFILLIFFIVTTVFVDETGVKVDKPRAASQQDIEKESILIGITAEGGVYYGGREIGIGGVRAVISRLQQEKQRPVVIQADRETDTEKTIEVLDEAKIGGAQTVFVSTVSTD